MDYIIHKTFKENLIKLHHQGGINAKVSQKIKSILFDHSQGLLSDPVSNLPFTNHGETRIDNCEKFKVFDSYRLITQKYVDKRVLLFLGNHDASEKFLNKNSNIKIFVDHDNKLNGIKVSSSVSIKNDNFLENDYYQKPLFTRLNKSQRDFIFTKLSSNIIYELSQITSETNDDEILKLLDNIKDTTIQNFIFDIINDLFKGDIDNIKKRIDLENGMYKSLDEIESIEVMNGEDVIVLKVGSDEYSDWITNFKDQADYYDWMLFTHPKQQEIVEEDYPAPSLLNGVSGSGKTCIIVKRAIRLARKKPDKPILIVTLNRSLSDLINKLVNKVCPPILRKNIQVYSFFELCQVYLSKFKNKDESKYFNDVTWKHDEHIDQIWIEYYRCFLNNYDAKCLLNIHKHFNERYVISENYLRDEFDWIRARFSNKERNLYFNVERIGRVVPIPENWRTSILQGLKGWEQKMADIGVIDYLGLSVLLIDHIDELQDDFSHVLIDEVQDFGKIELEILRKLVKKDENDIFMAGDEKQKASSKFRSFASAGINLHNSRIRKITKNYRNSREILELANEFYKTNIIKSDFIDDDFEILSPDYANFSTSKPKFVDGIELKNEISSSIYYLRNMLEGESNKKGCLAISGYTLRELTSFSIDNNFTILDGSLKKSDDFEKNSFFISDLEQMKGYEFDYVVICNLTDMFFPFQNSTEEELIQQIKLLYIAMTRAKTELILSYSKNPSKWFLETFVNNYLIQTNWESLNDGYFIDDYENPQKLNEFQKFYPIDYKKLSGFEFIYTDKAIGMSFDLQSKIEKYITGKNTTRDGNQIEWSDINNAVFNLKSNVTGRSKFGKDYKEFLKFFDN